MAHSLKQICETANIIDFFNNLLFKRYLIIIRNEYCFIFILFYFILPFIYADYTFQRVYSPLMQH